MRSSTLRRIMRRSHGVHVGAHSYGCFDPTRFPCGTRIGRYVSVGPDVAIYRRNHPLARLSLHPCFYNSQHGAAPGADVPTATLEIGADTWLGARAMILPGCRRIGRGAVVAAGAVVTRDVPAYAVVAGNPARVIRYRFEPEAIEAAERSRWWLEAPEAVARRFDMYSRWASSPGATITRARP
jgi:acetyltransferase-like isoleucine patch superfamily enzyme